MTSSDLKLDPQVEKLLRICCNALNDRKAEDLVVLDVHEVSSITNFLIIATGNVETHLKALRGEIDKTLKENNVLILGTDSSPGVDGRLLMHSMLCCICFSQRHGTATAWNLSGKMQKQSM